MAKLVIAEKPSVAKTIAYVIGADQKQNGYLCGNGYIVSWCFGHLAELASAEVYDEKYAKWAVEDLPIFPDPWHWSVGRDKGQQFFLIKNLMSRHDVDEIINACDAGREGELIFRTVYNLAKCGKPVKRLWISSMEDSAVLEGFKNLKDGREFDGIYESALCRAKADWLVGINGTRLFSILYHRTLNVGRVVSPTLALLVHREAEIDSFFPETFYTVEASFNGFKAVTEHLENKAEADAVCEKCPEQSMVVKSVKKARRSERAPALYDLTSLQRDANRILGYTAQQTLDYLQSLYEKKAVTYPRTDSRYLPEDIMKTVRDVVARSSEICGQPVPHEFSEAQVCCDAKVTDHHAIIPTASAAGMDPGSLLSGELEILKLVCRRVLVSVSTPYSWEQTEVELENKEAKFYARGRQVLNEGWREYLSGDNDSRQGTGELPVLKEWDVLAPVSAEVIKGETKPKDHLTEDTLLGLMEAAGMENMPEDAERKGLGTPSTRSGIIEKLIDTKLVERQQNEKKVNLIPSLAGKSLIAVLPEDLRSPTLTAEWENKLKNIEAGRAGAEEFMKGIESMVSDLVKNYEPVKGAEELFPSGREAVGRCPRCGKPVTESKKGYFCENNECRFGLWRDNRFLTSKKIDLNAKMVSSLLKDGRTFICGIYSEKKDKNYDAFICLDDDGQRTTYRIEFEQDNN
jgi:DNA topoisomerase-3